ncbi:MAG: redoxin domain-containing protein [Thermoguttaceae bacterium]|jgi:thiol-disulfide isomerase/thioredoxin/outer membrane lipoprotein-sorting protein|nr:redoxin domain-containing protein [Thermoguttaceae bacterium]
MVVPNDLRAGKAWLALLMALALAGGCSKPAEDAPSRSTGESESGGRAPGTLGTAREVLEAMVGAYRQAGSYADRGTIRFHVVQDGQTTDETDPFEIALQRPDKLRLQVYQARAVFDGNKLYAALDNLPGQVVVREAPKELSLDSLDRTQVLAPALGPGFARQLARLVLLLADRPLDLLLEGAQEPELAEPGEIEGRAYYRVRIRRENQAATLWIDQETLVVRRIVLPTEGLIDGTAGEVQSASLVAEFTGAELGAPIAPKAFQFQIPDGAEVVRFFQPPHPAELLGKQAPDFTFTDAGGNAISRESLAGKVAVLDFWATQCQPCREGLPSLDKVRRQYGDNPNVAFYAVNIDPPQTTDSQLAKVFAELNVQIPIVRDPEHYAATAFHIPGVPTLFVLDAKGIVQHYELGASPRLPTELPQTIDTLLAGGNTFESQRQQYEEQLRQMERAFDRAEASAGEAVPAGQQVPEAEISPRTQPQSFRLRPLWTNTELKSPGNVLAFPQSDGRPGLAVVDAWKRIAELSHDGKLAGMHEPPLEEVELFNALRTATDAEGRRYFAAVALMSGQQRFHLLDGRFQRLWSFPADALQNPHSGIADVQLGDLPGDGNLRAYVGYWGEVGVQEVSLEGQRVWGNRKVPNVQKMAVTGSGATGAGRLLCANVTGTLTVLDDQGELLPPITVPERLIGWLVAADLTGDGRDEYCALAAETLGENEAMGLALDGPRARVLWTYRLPDGVSRQPVEPIVPGRLSADGPGCWLLPGPDGSIHILSAEGDLLDKFNYGAAIQGLTTTQIDGTPVLVVCTAEGVAAWAVE